MLLDDGDHSSDVPREAPSVVSEDDALFLVVAIFLVAFYRVVHSRYKPQNKCSDENLN